MEHKTRRNTVSQLKDILAEIKSDREPKESEAVKNIRLKAYQYADETERELKNGAKKFVGNRPRRCGPFLEISEINMAIASAEFCKRHLDKFITELKKYKQAAHD